MLDHLRIKNFRCLRDVEVPLRPLTVLIGRNDTGKSAFLQAVENVVVMPNQIDNCEFWRGNSTEKIAITGKGSDCDYKWVFPASADQRVGKNPMRPDHEAGSHPGLGPVAKIHLPSQGILMQCEGFADGKEGDLELGADGGRIAALIDHLLRKDRKRFDEIVVALRRLVVGFQDIEVATPKSRTRRLDLVIENGFRIPAQSTSVGLRMLLFFVGLAYHPRPPHIVLLEEPENGVHPKRLEDIVRLLREITEGKHGQHAAQVILTTHSPYLLDQIDVDQDQVLIFQRNDDGSRSAEAADAERLHVFLDEFMLGEVWYNQGEEGLVSRK